MTFYVFHDLYESYRLVYVKEVVKYDWQIWVEGGGDVGGRRGSHYIFRPNWEK